MDVHSNHVHIYNICCRNGNKYDTYGNERVEQDSSRPANSRIPRRFGFRSSMEKSWGALRVDLSVVTYEIFPSNGFSADGTDVNF